jgi:DNA/RNA endonuclease YhcR with UshA esterase domain
VEQELTALISGRQRAAFSYLPESLAGQTICVRGVISTYQGKAQIIVSEPSQIRRDR